MCALFYVMCVFACIPGCVCMCVRQLHYTYIHTNTHITNNITIRTGTCMHSQQHTTHMQTGTYVYTKNHNHLEGNPHTCIAATHTCAYTTMHARTHAYNTNTSSQRKHAHGHTSRATHTHTHRDNQTQGRADTYTPTMHTCTHINTRIQARVLAHIHTYTATCTKQAHYATLTNPKHKHTHILIYVHTHLHTIIQAHTISYDGDNSKHKRPYQQHRQPCIHKLAYTLADALPGTHTLTQHCITYTGIHTSNNA